MHQWPNPDSEDMGRLVDGWLVSLHEKGASHRQMATAVRRLARIANRGWQAKTRGERDTLLAFQIWCQQQVSTQEDNGA